MCVCVFSSEKDYTRVPVNISIKVAHCLETLPLEDWEYHRCFILVKLYPQTTYDSY